MAHRSRRAQLHRAPRHAGPPRPEAAADARGHAQRHLLAPAGARDARRRSRPRTPTPTPASSVKYGITSSATVEGTVNPDFSQVESDAFQVEVNQRFPLFFSEKRPFFMEGMGSFELAGVGGDAVMRTAVHTRRIVDPVWGAKTTGTAGRVGFGMLAAGDEAPGRPARGRARTRSSGERKDFYIARSQSASGRSSYVGGILTDTEFGRGHNRVGGADLSLRFGPALRRAPRSWPPRPALPDGRETRTASAGRPTTRSRPSAFVFVTQMEHYDRGFQMDTAFLNQVGHHAGLELRGAELLSRTPRSTPGSSASCPSCSRSTATTASRAASRGSWCPACACTSRGRASSASTACSGRSRGRTDVRHPQRARLIGQAQFTRWLNVYAQRAIGRSIFYDEVDPYLGRNRAATTPR